MTRPARSGPCAIRRRWRGCKGWGAVAPFYIEQEAPVPPGGLPHPAPLKVQLRNEHLQYAITWYGLAAVLVVMFAVWAWPPRARAARRVAARPSAALPSPESLSHSGQRKSAPGGTSMPVLRFITGRGGRPLARRRGARRAARRRRPSS